MLKILHKRKYLAMQVHASNSRRAGEKNSKLLLAPIGDWGPQVVCAIARFISRLVDLA